MQELTQKNWSYLFLNVDFQEVSRLLDISTESILVLRVQVDVCCEVRSSFWQLQSEAIQEIWAFQRRFEVLSLNVLHCFLDLSDVNSIFDSDVFFEICFRKNFYLSSWILSHVLSIKNLNFKQKWHRKTLKNANPQPSWWSHKRSQASHFGRFYASASSALQGECFRTFCLETAWRGATSLMGWRMACAARYWMSSSTIEQSREDPSGAKALSCGDSPRGALRAVSKVSTQIWAFLKNLAFEESSSQSTTLYAKHSSIYLLSSFKKCTHFVLRPKLRATDWALFREKSVQKIYVH